MDPYKQATQHLSAELATASEPSHVASTVEQTVRRWVRCDRVELRPAGGESESSLPSGDVLTLPACFAGRNVGWLVVQPKPGPAPFTSEEIDLLRTIADQAALALAHATRYAEWDRRQRERLAAWQTERVALVETVAAEIAHEVRYPINFFRSVFRRDKGNARLDDEEIDIGCEEVDRLERLVSGLRRIAGSRIERNPIAVTDLVFRAEALLRDALGARTLSLDVPTDAVLRCDPHQATQLLVNLVANAIEATSPQGTVGIAWALSGEGAQLTVWDDGQGFDGDASRLFTPWFTTKPRGTGLGLAITQRIVRAHGWSIDAKRTQDQTRFVVSVPPSDVVAGERRTDPSPFEPLSTSESSR